MSVLGKVINSYTAAAVFTAIEYLGCDKADAPDGYDPELWRKIFLDTADALVQIGRAVRDPSKKCGFKTDGAHIDLQQHMTMEEHFTAAKTIATKIFYEPRTPEEKICKSDQTIIYAEDLLPRTLAAKFAQRQAETGRFYRELFEEYERNGTTEELVRVTFTNFTKVSRADS